MLTFGTCSSRRVSNFTKLKYEPDFAPFTDSFCLKFIRRNHSVWVALEVTRIWQCEIIVLCSCRRVFRKTCLQFACMQYHQNPELRFQLLLSREDQSVEINRVGYSMSLAFCIFVSASVPTDCKWPAHPNNNILGIATASWVKRVASYYCSSLCLDSVDASDSGDCDTDGRQFVGMSQTRFIFYVQLVLPSIILETR